MIEIQNISYTDAWTFWFQGKSTAGYLMWGLPILWIGRLGKIAGFIGALTIVAEIIGAEKIRLFGNSLHKQFSLQTVKHHLKMASRSINLVFEVMEALAVETPPERLRDFFSMPIGKKVKSFFSTSVGILTIIILIGPTFIFTLISPDHFSGILVGFICAVFLLPLAPFISTLLILLTLFVLYLIDLIFIEPLAWLFERESLDKIVKIINILMVIIGFHFDLLAS